MPLGGAVDGVPRIPSPLWVAVLPGRGEAPKNEWLPDRAYRGETTAVWSPHFWNSDMSVTEPHPTLGPTTEGD